MRVTFSVITRNYLQVSGVNFYIFLCTSDFLLFDRFPVLYIRDVWPEFTRFTSRKTLDAEA